MPLPEGRVSLVVEFELLPEKLEAFLAIIKEHAERSREEEPGCLQFDVLLPCQRDGTPIAGSVHLFEQYENEAALAHHEGTPRMKEVGSKIAELVKSTKITHTVLNN